MKKLISIFLALILVIQFTGAADFITCTCTITNAPTVHGNTITVNSSLREWTNSVVTANSQILTNATIGGSATNLFNHFGTYGPAGVIVQRDGTNAVKFRGFNLTASVSANWATLTCATNASTNVWQVAVPFSIMGATNRTIVASQLVLDLTQYSTNAFNQNSNVMSEVVGLTNTQTISTGVKTFTGANIYANAAQFFHGGTISNVVATNLISFNGYIIGWVTNTDGFISGGTLTNNSIVHAALISGTVSTLTNGGWINPKLTNGINYGNAFSSVGSAANSEQFGSGSIATHLLALAVGRLAISGGVGSTAVGFGSIATSNSTTAVGSASLASGENATAIGSSANATKTNATAIGEAAKATHANSTALGRDAQTTAENQVIIGSGTDQVYLNGRVESSVGYTNATMIGTNVVTAGIHFTRLDNTSLANGNNAAVDIGGTAGGSRTYVKVSGPTAAFNINGIAGGANGRFVKIENSTGFNMTIVNDSGVDPTAANRVYTGTGSDVTITNNPGFALFTYDTAVSRWKLENGPSTSVAGVTSVALTAPTAVFDIAGSPVTGSGTLAITFDNQSANTFFAGPTTGAAATPTFRAIVSDDFPAATDLGGKTSFEVPNAASPTTDAFGEIAGDNDAWAASRGALQIYDGTANTYAVATLASDAPANGEVPVWNTGGTVTWEMRARPLNFQSTATGNVGAGEDTIFTYTVPASTLAVDGQCLSFDVAGTVANNSNGKRIRVKYGATTIYDSSSVAIQNEDWRISGRIYRTGAATQKTTVSVVTTNPGSLLSSDYTTPTETLSGTVVLTITAEATADNDVVGQLWKVNFEP